MSLLEFFFPSLGRRKAKEDYFHQCERYYHEHREEQEEILKEKKM